MCELYIITGSNGAGKSTVGPEYLPQYISKDNVVFDGDKLYMQKQRELWQSGIRAHKEAKKLAFAFVTETFDSLVENALSTKSNFVYEGHFTNEATWDIPRKFKAAGYSIHLIFFGLTDTKLSELRVVARAQKGGHYVDPSTIADNFYGNLEKLNFHYNIFNSLQLVDTSEIEPRVLAIFLNGEVESAIEAESLPKWFQTSLPDLTKKIRLGTNEGETL